MKITVEVNLEEGWFDEDQNLDEALKSTISNQVKNEIWAKIKDKITDQIQRDVHNFVEKEYINQIRKVISNIIETDEIKNPNYYANSSDPERLKKFMTLKEYIKYEFLKNTGNWNSPKPMIEKLAKSFSDEMKDRYDLMFASQLVSKISEQGLLKDGVFKALMEKNGE